MTERIFHSWPDSGRSYRERADTKGKWEVLIDIEYGRIKGDREEWLNGRGIIPQAERSWWETCHLSSCLFIHAPAARSSLLSDRQRDVDHPLFTTEVPLPCGPHLPAPCQRGEGTMRSGTPPGFLAMCVIVMLATIQQQGLFTCQN